MHGFIYMHILIFNGGRTGKHIQSGSALEKDRQKSSKNNKKGGCRRTQQQAKSFSRPWLTTHEFSCSELVPISSRTKHSFHMLLGRNQVTVLLLHRNEFLFIILHICLSSYLIIGRWISNAESRLKTSV